MKRLERDRTVVKWTKNHGITIQYVTEAGNVRGYRPDFLIERFDGAKQLHEIKSGRDIRNRCRLFATVVRSDLGQNPLMVLSETL